MSSKKRKHAEPKPIRFASFLRKKQMHAAKVKKDASAKRSKRRKKSDTRTLPVAATIDLTGMDITVPLPEYNANLRMMPTAISSAEWLQDDAKTWRLRHAKQVRDKHVAIRWRASPYALGKTPRRPTLETAGLDMIALSNNNKWEPWLSIRTSTVTPDPKEGENPGLGLFAARVFQFDDIVTRYCGKTTGVDTNMLKQWEKHKWKQFYTFKGKQCAVCLGDIEMTIHHYHRHCRLHGHGLSYFAY